MKRASSGVAKPDNVLSLVWWSRQELGPVKCGLRCAWVQGHPGVWHLSCLGHCGILLWRCHAPGDTGRCSLHNVTAWLQNHLEACAAYVTTSRHLLHAYFFHTVQATVREPTRRNMYKGVSLAYTTIVLCYWSVAFAGYWAFGSNVEAFILASLTNPTWPIVMAHIFSVIQIVGCYQVKSHHFSF